MLIYPGGFCRIVSSVLCDLPTVVEYTKAQCNISQCRRDYNRAVQELEIVVLKAFTTFCSKPSQELVFLDVLKAISLCERWVCDCSARPPNIRSFTSSDAWCSSQNQAAVKQLVAAAELFFPQAKRSQVSREYKQKSVALRRAEKKSGMWQLLCFLLSCVALRSRLVTSWRQSLVSPKSTYWHTDKQCAQYGACSKQLLVCLAFAAAQCTSTGSDVEADPLPESAAQQLPPEVIDHIFAALNPQELAVACGVCGAWRAAASSDHLWQRHCLREKIRESEPAGPRDAKRRWHQVFAQAMLGTITLMRFGLASLASPRRRAMLETLWWTCLFANFPYRQTGACQLIHKGTFAAQRTAPSKPGLKWTCNRFAWRGALHWRDPAAPGLTTVAGARLAGDPYAATYPKPSQVRIYRLLKRDMIHSRYLGVASERCVQDSLSRWQL